MSKPSYRAPKWALMVRLMQQERRKSPQKSIFQKTGPFGDVTETAILSFWPAISEAGWPRQQVGEAAAAAAPAAVVAGQGAAARAVLDAELGRAADQPEHVADSAGHRAERDVVAANAHDHDVVG